MDLKMPRITTWNINSVRLRLPTLQRLCAETSPDIVCLQETKTPDADFPLAPIKAMGYEYCFFTGMKSYCGVAILSRLPFSTPTIHEWAGKKDCRHISVKIGRVEIHSLYVPAGGDIPDVKVNEKFAHKLQFLDDITSWWAMRRGQSGPAIMAGDFNIAPLEQDVWSHRQLIDVVSHTPVEVARLKALQATMGWCDSLRHFVPETEKLYSWWSYRAQDWQASDRGRRLDHIWVTPDLRPTLQAGHILKAARGWEQPSDHVPVMVDVDNSFLSPP
jgi:exodeoxyribonuclease III